jgi:TolB-like protein/Tfp pilus assembly protein PilF
MATSRASTVTICSICGEPLNAKGDCIACLLRRGLGGSIAQNEPSASLVFGDFEVLRREDGSFRELGRGAFGVTYLAVDNVLRRRVALKVIDVPAGARGSNTMRERFLREARAAAVLRHPNIAAIYQFGASPNGSRCFYAMELVQGETLETRVRRDGPLNPKFALEIASQIARALRAAAAQGLIHRDLKPANIMLTSGDAETAELEVKVIDFGLAKAIADAGGEMDLTHGEFVGTPTFASPEQFGRGPVDARSDIYSLGATLWFALTGLAPHPGSTIEEIRDRQTRDDLPVQQLAARKVPAPVIKLLRSLLAVDALEFCRQQLGAGSGGGSFFSQLKERHVVRVAIAYGVTAWLLAQIATQIFPFFEVPNWGVRLVILALVIGFPIALALAWAFEITPEGIVRTEESVPSESSRRHTHYTFTVGITLVTLAAIGLFAFRLSRQKPSSAPINESAAAVSSKKSIAVLPFENASNEPNTEYLSEGISEALINSLSELQQLRVIARPMAFRYKQKDVDPRQVGRELGVAAVLTGKVRQMQDALNVQVDLVDAVSGAEIWGAGYARKITDLLAIKQAIAQQVTAKLKLKLSSEEQRRLVKHDTTNPEAYQFYLRGRYFWDKRTSDGIKQAIEHFQQSIERDPNFALGYVGLADSYTGLTFYNFAAPREAMPKAKESAIKALTLDETLAEAHATLAHILVNYDWNWSAAEKEFKRSIELKPDYATAHQWYAIHYLTATGRLEEAVQEMKRALELEPASLVMNTFMGATFYYAGRYDEAIDQCRRTIQMDPNFAVAHWHLGLAYEQKQLLDAATEEFKKAISLSGGSPLMKAALGRAYAELQNNHEANEMLNELNELAKRQYASAYEIATICVALGNNEEAFQLLEKAYAEHSFHLVNLNVSPQFKSVRSDPRFQDLVQRIGLSQSASNPVAAEKSIAVLPFENLSNDKANAYFAEGIQDEILTRLSKISDLKVISRTSTQHYKSAPVNLPEIAKQLGVAHILEGRVQKSGDAVRVNVQLIKAANDSHLWADTFDRKLTDIFSVESEVAKAIADQLRAKLTGREEQVIAAKPTESSEAHQLYLKGRYFWNKRTSDGLKTSIDYFNQAIDKDPAYGPAYAGLADAYAVLPNYSQTRGKEAYPKAEAAAMKALEIDDKLAEAHIALANVRVWHKWARGAEPEFKRGLELNRNYSTGHQWYSIYLSVLGRHNEAISEMEKAQELDPFSIIINTEVGCPYLYSKRYDRAIEYFSKAIQMDPDFPFAHFALAEAYDRTGRFHEALEEHQHAIDLAHRGQAFDLAGGDAPRAWYALTGPLQNAYAALRGATYWQARLESAKKSYEENTATATRLAEIYAILGDKEQALAWLAKAYEQSDDFLVFINIQPQFDKLRSDLRFQALVNKIFQGSGQQKNE